MSEITIDRRFCGPKNSANGGYAAGVFAQKIDGPAEVTLIAPPPLETPIALAAAEDGGYEAIHNGAVIARAKPAQVDAAPPPVPSFVDVEAAHNDFLKPEDGVHLIPHCFVCGTRRKPGDGLRIFSGPVPDSPVNADFWTPGADLADGDGLVKPEFLWAALDCPSAFAMRAWPEVSLLGRLAAEIKRRPKAEERLIAAGWPRSREGRKMLSSSALYTESGEVIAVANAVWIILTDPKMLAQLKADRGDDRHQNNAIGLL